MRPVMTLGLVLVILGIVLLGYQGYAYFTTRDTIAQIGPVDIRANREHAIPLGPIFSGIALAGGIILLIVGSSRARVP